MCPGSSTAWWPGTRFICLQAASAMPGLLLGKFALKEEKKMMDDGENLISFFFS